MLKELVQFTESALIDKDFKTYGLSPKLGLHIVLKVADNGIELIKDQVPTYDIYSKKVKNLTPIHKKAAAWSQAAWMVSTNKCFDLPSRAIHTCSPFCFGVKRENLEGGVKYKANANNGKTQVYERIDAYFKKAQTVLTDKEESALSNSLLAL